MKELLKKWIPKVVLNKYQDYKKQEKIDSYKGNEVECAVCNSHYKVFAPYGLVVRENARCHNCNALERHRLLWKYLKDKTNLFSSKKPIKVLHFAPEPFFYKALSRMEHIQYIPCDLFPELYDFKGQIEVVKVDITAIPFEDNYFDFILCNHVLEHIPNDGLAMSELFRVMKKDGWGIFQVPIDYNREKTYEDFSITSREERQKAFGQEDHVRWYGKDYKDRLKKAGFNVKEDDFVKQFSKQDLYRFGLMPSELIYNCSKN